MMQSLQQFARYEAYQDSGVEWLGEIPEGWGILPIKRMIVNCTNGLWGTEPNGLSDLVVLRVADFDRQKLCISDEKLTVRSIPHKDREGRLLRRGDLLIEKSGGGDKTLVGCVVLFDKDYDAITSNFVAKMTPKTGVNSNFLNFIFNSLYSQSVNYVSIKQTTGIQNLDTESYFKELVPYPPLAEQTAIANFLDQKTAEIDQAIALKTDLIERLKEYKQITIQHAVTRGLDPNAKMKASGVEWIGDIPEGWEITANRTLFIESKDAGSEGLPLLSVSIHSGVSTGELDESENVRGRVKIEDKSQYVAVQPNDIVFNMMRAWQGAIGAVRVAGMVSPAYIVARPRHAINAHFFEYQYRSPLFISQMNQSSKGITDFRKRLYWNEFKQLFTVAPPLAEQAAIVAHIEAISAKIDQATDQAQQQINTLTEYKTVLINAAVTGKIKVT